MRSSQNTYKRRSRSPARSVRPRQNSEYRSRDGPDPRPNPYGSPVIDERRDARSRRSGSNESYERSSRPRLQNDATHNAPQDNESDGHDSGLRIRWMGGVVANVSRVLGQGVSRIGQGVSGISPPSGESAGSSFANAIEISDHGDEDQRPSVLNPGQQANQALVRIQ